MSSPVMPFVVLTVFISVIFGAIVYFFWTEGKNIAIIVLSILVLSLCSSLIYTQTYKEKCKICQKCEVPPTGTSAPDVTPVKHSCPVCTTCAVCPPVVIPPGAENSKYEQTLTQNTANITWPEHTYFPHGYSAHIMPPVPSNATVPSTNITSPVSPINPHNIGIIVPK
jgi:hypothetical protein